MQILVNGVDILEIIGKSIAEYKSYGFVIGGFYFGLISYKFYQSSGIENKFRNRKIKLLKEKNKRA